MNRAGITALFAIIARAGNQIFVILVTLVATRYLHPTEFGVFALASMMVMLARTLLYAGPYEFLLKSDDEPRWATPCLLVTLSLAVSSFCVLALLVPVWPYIFGPASDGTLLLMLAGSILPSAIAAWQESLMLRQRRLMAYYGITVVAELLTSAVAILLLVKGFGLMALVAQLYLRGALLIVCFRVANRPPALCRPQQGDFRQVLRWSSARYGSVLVNFASNYSGDMVLGVVLGPAATGIYRAANRIVTAVSDVVSQPTSMLSVTGLSSLRASGEPLDGRWLTMFAGIAWFGVPALIGLAVLSDLVAPIALGPQWAAAGPVIAVLCLARIFALINVAPGAALVAYDRQHWLFLIQLGIAVGNACLTMIAAQFGMLAVAWSVTFVTMTGSVLIVTCASRITRQRVDWVTAAKIVLPPTLVVELTALLARESFAPFLPSSPMLLAAAVTAGSIAWFATVLVIRKPAFAALQVLTHGR